MGGAAPPRSPSGLTEREGILLREAPPWRDDLAFADALSYRPLGIREGDRVLDLGAHVGCFTRRVALPAGAAIVAAVEPHPETFAMLSRNCCAFAEVDLLNVAVAGIPGPTPLFVSDRNSLTNSMYVRRGRSAVVVATSTLACAPSASIRSGR